MKSKQCCPPFEPKKWENKTHNWENKPFIKETIPTFFHIPFPPMIGKKITKMWEQVKQSKAEPKDIKDWLVLFHDPSAFKSEIFMSAIKKVKGANNQPISGTFISKVFAGPYNAIPKFIKEMDNYLKKQNKKAKDYYVHYAYCPKCAKKFGKNYIILFAEV